MFYSIIKNIAKIICLVVFRVKTYNAENFNNLEGKCILCCNHISLWDPVVVGSFVKRQVNFMAKKELFDKPLLGIIIRGLKAFPVDRTGASFSAIKNAINLLKEEKVLGIFPEGTRVKEYNEENAKAGIAMIANMSKSPVIPVYIKSNYKLFGKVELIFGKPKNYFEAIEGKITTQHYNEIGKQILKDIYSLENEIPK